MKTSFKRTWPEATIGKGGNGEFGLYIHIPFCSHLCHYCDFAKTAYFDAESTRQYFTRLREHLCAWLAVLRHGGDLRFSSVFFGGGTPGLFSTEYAPLFELLHQNLAADAELSLEANPSNITCETLRTWRQLGFNRLSIGVQTFSSSGLTFLKRDHDAGSASHAVALAREEFNNVNVDLIYGWPAQTGADWERDLRESVQLGATHLSLYALTYEARTPIGRAKLRGRLEPMPETHEAQRYERARDVLATLGYEHDEVSNWARPDHTCRHNWLYWQDGHYLGVGAGAHGYLPLNLPIGLRYAYPRQVREFSVLPPPPLADDLRASVAAAGLSIDERDLNAWLLEFISCGLRTRRGISISRLEAETSQAFTPSPLVAEALGLGLMHLDDARQLTLVPSEWFREQAWSLQVAASFAP